MNKLEILEEHLEICDSTMEEVKKRFQNEEIGFITTKIQKSGRGSQGRSWTCVEGNLFMTFSYPKNLAIGLNPGLWPLAAGIALYEAAQSFIISPSPDILRLKWPNDLLLQGRKCAGMLLEGWQQRILVGVGVNIHGAPLLGPQERPTACLGELGFLSDNTIPLARLFCQKYLELLNADNPNARVMEKWVDCIDWSHHVILRSPSPPWITGTELKPLSLDSSGGLWVQDSNGVKKMLVASYLY